MTIEVNFSNDKERKCFSCDMPAETEIIVHARSGNAIGLKICGACECDMYHKLGDFRQRKLSYLLTEINKQQK